MVLLEDANFTWDREEENNPTLKAINLSIARGSLVAVVGAVGSGKSSLIMAILGQMHLSAGARYFQALSAAYVAQDHWIQNVSVYKNILFGSSSCDIAYERALDASQLSRDLLNLPSADFTEIGERGINLRYKST